MRSFVTASALTQRLCSSRDGQELLPHLIGRLISASIPGGSIRDFRFPHGDQISLHGPDGLLVTDIGVSHPRIPAGVSLWEMGTSTDPKTKANQDFKTAAKKLAQAFPGLTQAVTPDKAVFVFVTSTSWDSSGWIKGKHLNSKWRSIKVLDAVDLEKWLEQCPAVMLWFADVCGLPAEGLYDSEQYLQRLAVGYGLDGLTPELVRSGRDDCVLALDSAFLKSDKDFTICGESAEEAAAFLASSALRQPDEYKKKAPLVFADSKANLTVLAALDAALTLVPLDCDTMTRAKTIKNPTWRVVIPEVESIASRTPPADCIRLGTCNRAATEQCLIAQFAFSAHKARQFARDSKGSLTALLWMVGSGPLGIPRWASRKDATTHSSLMMAGSWIGSNEHDTKIVERLSRNSYRDIETLLQSATLPEGPWVHRGAEWVCVSRRFVWTRLIGKVTETMLNDFQAVVHEVIGEEDPSQELPPAKRYMAGILGKTRKYSNTLRKGLADSIARLAILRADGQDWADLLVRDLLHPEHPESLESWCSLKDVFSDLAEAAPTVFLDRLDSLLQQEEAGRFFETREEDDVMLSFTSAHIYLIWALERLAWLPQHLSRVLRTLSRLADIDPGVSTGNSPASSLVTILLPWSPQHSGTLQESISALRMLYSLHPQVTWSVAVQLLSRFHGVTLPTPVPEYRDSPGQRAITMKEYREFVLALVQLMVLWAREEPRRWAQLVEVYPEVVKEAPEAGQHIVSELGQLDAAHIPEEDGSLIHHAIVGILARHRGHSDANWAISGASLLPLEALQPLFMPTDAVLQGSSLFSWQVETLDAPMEEYAEGWDEWIRGKRIEAVKAVYDQAGIKEIDRLVERVQVPEMVGDSAAGLTLSGKETSDLISSGLAEDPGKGDVRTRVARAYISRQYREVGAPWLESILASRDIKWTPHVYANLALSLPVSPEMWEQVETWSTEAADLYWKNVSIPTACYQYWEEVLARWEMVGRPWSAIALLARLVDEKNESAAGSLPSADDVIRLLELAVRSDEGDEPGHRQAGTFSHDVDVLFRFLDTQAVAPERMARLEWAWFYVLEHTPRGARALPREIVRSAELFVDLLKVIFRAKNEEPPKPPEEQESKLAERAYSVLQGIRTVPGQQMETPGARVDAKLLRDWVTKARDLARTADRLGVCDTQIGTILSFAPASADESWPCEEVRDVIEWVESQDLQDGLCVGKMNQRGAIFRAKGGKQDWELAQTYKELAEKVRTRWPRTAAVLDCIRRSYEHDARFWDEHDKRQEFE